jgi:hypothetical protein
MRICQAILSHRRRSSRALEQSMHPAQPGSHHSNRVRTALICTAEWIDAGRMPVNQQPPTWPMATTHTFSVMPSVSDPDDTVQRWVTGGRCERSLSGLACPTDRCLARSRWHHKYSSKYSNNPAEHQRWRSLGWARPAQSPFTATLAQSSERRGPRFKPCHPDTAQVQRPAETSLNLSVWSFIR